jgi:N-acylneuraminate cytidylyltransferase
LADKRIAIIPARCGSKRIPHKNVHVFAGRPLLAHAIDIARASSLFDEIHVSTDCDVIADVAAANGVPVPFRRPDELSDDQTPLLPVLQWVLSEYASRGQSYGVGCMLMSTAVLVEPTDLSAALRVHVDAGGRTPTLAVCRYPAPVEWAMVEDASGLLTSREPGMAAVRSQDLPPAFFDSGTFMFFAPDLMLSGEHPGRGFQPFLLDRRKGVDIDDPEDLEHAAALWRARAASAGA